MDVWEIAKILIRRWYVMIPILILGAVVAISSSNGIHPEYKADAVLLVLPPTEYEPGATDAGGVVNLNPYTALGPKTVAQAIVFQMNGDATHLDLDSRGLTSEYVVQASQRDPLISIAVTGDDQTLVAETMGAVITATEDELVRMQQPFVDKVIPEQLTIEELSRTAVPSEDFTSRSRLKIAVAALSALLAAAAAIFVDGIVDRVSRNRSARSSTDTDTVARISTDEADEILSSLDSESSSAGVGGGRA